MARREDSCIKKVCVTGGANLPNSILAGIESRYKQQVHGKGQGRTHRPQKSATSSSFAGTTDSAEVNEVGPYKKGKREIGSTGENIFVTHSKFST